MKVIPFPVVGETRAVDRAIQEVQLCLHILARPELALELDPALLSPLPAELVSLISLAPTLCREIGAPLLIANCFTSYPGRKTPGVLAFANWLARTPRLILESLPPFEPLRDEIMNAGSRKGAA